MIRTDHLLHKQYMRIVTPRAGGEVVGEFRIEMGRLGYYLWNIVYQVCTTIDQ